MDDRKFMEMAIEEAHVAYKKGEVPVGVVITCDGKVVSRAHNRVEELKNPLLHAEILALLDLYKRGYGKYLQNCTVYVTLEPCVMCTAALLKARVKRVVFGLREPRFGGIFSVNKLENYGDVKPFEVIEGVFEERIKYLMDLFFKGLRCGRDARVDEGGGLENR